MTSGTILAGTRKPLTDWLGAMWYVCSTKHGVSALGLQKVLGLGSYETAWAWLHKLRRAMVVPGRDLLTGDVEVDETIVGGSPQSGVMGRRLGKKALVVIGAECRGGGSGRIRLARIPNASRVSLHGFIRANVEPGSVLLTDGWPPYAGIDQHGYLHKAVSINASTEEASELLPRTHRVASLLKRWLLSTHQGAPQPAQLDYYLDEFTFRFNRRSSQSRGLLFHRLCHQAITTAPQPYGSLVQGPRTRKKGVKRNHKM